MLIKGIVAELDVHSHKPMSLPQSLFLKLCIIPCSQLIEFVYKEEKREKRKEKRTNDINFCFCDFILSPGRIRDFRNFR